ncbi:helix-hairpin-helix domain-containing protein [Roseivirga sp.]|uniref:helix-hairpin-helix domain-containing protein n=1 Tax=Roseivirga sp. TaxID=1964215 RepID=UPI003B52BC95
MKFLSFSKTEINGTVFLLIIIVCLLLSPQLYKIMLGDRYDSFEEDQALLDSLMSAINSSVSIEPVFEPKLSEFNPNEASLNELVSLGIPEFLSKRIIGYRNAGGVFKVKSDLMKIYNFPDSLFFRLESYIRMEDELQIREKERSVEKRTGRGVRRKAAVLMSELRFPDEPRLIDINLADTTLFQKLHGIGSTYAKRIVAFREALGGFYSVDQVSDLYGMTDSLYYQIKSFLTISDTVKLKVIPINVATFEQLNSHPYISYELTKEILLAKSKYGKFKKLEDLSRLSLLDSLGRSRLGPYLRF